LSGCAKDEAVKNFNALASDIKQLQNDISTKISDSQTLLSVTNTKDLDDPTLVDQLKSQIDSANSVSVAVPPIASDTAAINQQIQGLTTIKNNLQKQSDSLDSTVFAINASKQKLLEAAITPKDTHNYSY
jgi:septal ring factor EnvC (AmiA/AmiB activator)